MRKKIDDERLFSLLNIIFKGKVSNVEIGGPDCRKGIGVPQGNPLSPLLCNIYLTELDLYVESLKKENDLGTTLRKRSPE